MRISELSEEAGVPIPTIKYYLREGVLPPGRLIAPNQARYAEEHVRRLRLVRALVEVGGLPLASVREVLEAVDDPDLPIHEALGIAQRALGRGLEQDDNPEVADARTEVDSLLQELGWDVSPDSPGRDELAIALATLRRLRWPDASAKLFTRYAKALDRLAAREVQRAAPVGVSKAEAMERVVIGTVVFDAVISALRRLAHERHSALRSPTSIKQ
jgi:DNA-binding transcriptional MerR regulator